MIEKFTIIAIAAIVGIILIAMSSLPILRSVNLYEEKILLIVSRINFDSSQVEKLKLNVCSQLLSLDTFDWLKYNYCEVMAIQFD